jgi:hypothetical protein
VPDLDADGIQIGYGIRVTQRAILPEPDFWGLELLTPGGHLHNIFYTLKS